MIRRSEYFSVANDTKWRELRAAIINLDDWDRSRFRSQDLDNGYLSQSEGGWQWMERADLSVETGRQRDLLRAILRRIRFAGEETAEGVRVYGSVRNGEVANYIE